VISSKVVSDILTQIEIRCGASDQMKREMYIIAL
jgi:hypothetical protein